MDAAVSQYNHTPFKDGQIDEHPILLACAVEPARIELHESRLPHSGLQLPGRNEPSLPGKVGKQGIRNREGNELEPQKDRDRVNDGEGAVDCRGGGHTQERSLKDRVTVHGGGIRERKDDLA